MRGQTSGHGGPHTDGQGSTWGVKLCRRGEGTVEVIVGSYGLPGDYMPELGPCPACATRTAPKEQP